MEVEQQDAPSLCPEELIAEGNRCMASQNVASAVESFQEACAQLVRIHGQLAKELAEPYYLYGRALLEVSRLESFVLGNGIVAQAEQLSSDEGEEEEEEEEEEDQEEESGVQAQEPTSTVAAGNSLTESINCSSTVCENNHANSITNDSECTSVSAEAIISSDACVSTNTPVASDSAVPTDAPLSSDVPSSSDVPGPSDSCQAIAGSSGEPSPGGPSGEPSTGAPSDEPSTGGPPNEPSTGGPPNEPSTTGGPSDEPSTTGGPSDEPSAIGGPSDEAGPSNDTAGGTTGTEEEDVTDLQLAWQVLELARVICTREEGEEYKLKLSDVHLALAEVAMESDLYEEAVEDLKSCLSIREAYAGLNSRQLAEVHFTLGLAYSLWKKPSQAAEEYKTAKGILESKMENLKQLAATTENGEERSDFENEIAELQGLLPDIEAKIIDAEEEIKNGEQKAEQTFPADNTNTAVLSEAKIALKASPISDISHLVRKRKADDQVQPECKHPKQDLKDCDKENKEVPSNGNGEDALATVTEC